MMYHVIDSNRSWSTFQCIQQSQITSRMDTTAYVLLCTPLFLIFLIALITNYKYILVFHWTFSIKSEKSLKIDGNFGHLSYSMRIFHHGNSTQFIHIIFPFNTSHDELTLIYAKTYGTRANLATLLSYDVENDHYTNHQL